MGLKLKKKDEFTLVIPLEDGEQATVLFKFPYAEEKDNTALRELKKRFPQTQTVKVDGKERELFLAWQNMYYCSLRTAIHSYENIEFEGIEVGEDGITEQEQKIIFDYIQGEPELFRQVELAAMGIKGGNLKSGEMQSQTGDGLPDTAPPASSETNVE